MTKVDLKKEFEHLYNPSAREVSVVDVPQMYFLMIDGRGDPNTSEEYAEALEALYAVSYAEAFGEGCSRPRSCTWDPSRRRGQR